MTTTIPATTAATLAAAAGRPTHAITDPTIWVPDEDNPDLCAVCCGVGGIRYRNHYRRCTACDGTGWFHPPHRPPD